MPLAPDLSAWLRLSLTTGLGGEALRKLLSAFGGPEQVLGASRTALTAVVSGKIADAILDGNLYGDVAVAEAWLNDTNNHVVTLADAEYPQALLQTADPPPLIYVKGRLELLNQPAIAVVGSRNATAQGKLTAESFATALSNAGRLYRSAAERAAGARSRNEPAELPRIASHLAALRHWTLAQTCAITTANALAALPRLAGLWPPAAPDQRLRGDSGVSGTG